MNNSTPGRNESEHFCFACMMTGCIDNVCRLPRQAATWLNQHLKPLSPLLLRLLLAYEFGEAGLEKLHGENWFADLIFPFPFNLLPVGVAWHMAMWLEIIGAIALIAGFMTRFFSAALVVLTVVAIAAVHWPAEWQTLSELWQGYAITDKGFGNYKLPLMYLFMLGSLLLSGSGRLSIDHCLKKRAASQAYSRPITRG